MHIYVCGNFAALFDPTGESGEPCDTPGIFTTPLDGGDFVDVWSLYAAVGFDITDRLTLDVEGRDLVDKRSDGISPVTTTFKDFIPRVTLTYSPTDNVTTYGLVTQGILPGVVNANFNVCQDHTFTEPLTWAERLKRVFEFDITLCPCCGGRLRVIANVTDPAVIRKILDHLQQRAPPEDRQAARAQPYAI